MADSMHRFGIGSTTVNILLRVPLLFVLDHVALVNFGSSPSPHFLSFNGEDLTDNSDLLAKKELSNLTDTSTESISSWPVLLHTYAFLLAFVLLLLSSERLWTVYRYLIADSIIYFWIISNRFHLHSTTFSLSEFLIQLLQNPTSLINSQNYYFAIQLLSLALFTLCRSHGNKWQTLSILIAQLLAPVLVQTFSSQDGLLSFGFLLLPWLTAPLLAFVYLMKDACTDLKRAFPSAIEDLHWCRSVLRYHGILALFESQWNRLNLPSVLKAFWISKAALLFSVWLHSKLFNEGSQFLWTTICKRLLLSNCETLVSLLGSSAIICFLCDSFGHIVMRWFIQAPDDSDEKSVGPVSAILFFVLALQTGLTEISGELRFVRLYQNLCLLLTANLHLLHNTLSQVLFWLSASRNNSISRHIRALVACVLLAVISIVLAVVLARNHSFGSWLLAVIAFCVEMVIKVVLTLIVYGLFMLDAHRLSLWESLDDYVFYVRSLSSSVEFLFAIIIFMNGVWILIYESGGRIRAFMVGVHLYFNIWLQAIEGIRVILKRRKAAKKLNFLYDATPAQLQEFEDVCAICYEELASAKITACRHYFHAVCLRKWLNIQNTCPICQEVIFSPEMAAAPDRNQAAAVAVQQEPLQAADQAADQEVDQNLQL